MIIYLVCGVFGIITIIAAVVYSADAFKRKGKIKESLAETEKQVKIKPSYDGFPEILVLSNLLEGATITAKPIKETNKVILRFELIDDEGKTFFKSLEFDADRIIYDLEIL